MPRTDFRLSHTAHRQRSRKRQEQKSPELRPCARAEREAAALGAHYFLHSCTSCCLKYLRSSSSTSTKLRKYLTENLLLMFLNVGVRLSNLRACKRTQAWARGVALHAGAGRPPIAGWAVVRSPAKEESDRDGLASDGRAWQRWEDGAWCAALVSSEATCNVRSSEGCERKARLEHMGGRSGGTVHDLKLGDRLALVERVGSTARACRSPHRRSRDAKAAHLPGTRCDGSIAQAVGGPVPRPAVRARVNRRPDSRAE